jgi:hypothetical protein
MANAGKLRPAGRSFSVNPNGAGVIMQAEVPKGSRICPVGLVKQDLENDLFHILNLEDRSSERSA